MFIVALCFIKPEGVLDFYLISDSEGRPKPNELKNLDYAGGLESDIYDRLVRKRIIDSRFDYYSDFRWDSQLVKQIEFKTKNSKTDSDIIKLNEIINEAIKKGFGLVAYGD